MKVLSATQIREADRATTEKLGITALQLMENAAQAVVAHLLPAGTTGASRSFVVLCGKGNNGGDGLAIARLLKARGENVHVVLLANPEELSVETKEQWKRWQETGGAADRVRSNEDWIACRRIVGKASHVVDAILGVGVRGPVDGLLKTVIEDVNHLQRRSGFSVTAVDMPSGLPADGSIGDGLAMRATRTITFTAPKLGLLLGENLEFVGELLPAFIGTPDDLLPDVPLRWIEPSEFRDLPLRRKQDGHKGDFGHALLVAGSRGKAGAAALAGLGALHAGAGLVTVATPENSLPVVAGHAPELMTEALPETEAGTLSLSSLDYARMEKLQQSRGVLAIGPGLGTHPETQELIRALVKTSTLPLVLDADGLNAFAGCADDLAERQSEFLAITPHPGEMARLLGRTSAQVQADRIRTAQEAAVRWNCAVILKGAGTIVAFPSGKTYLNTTGNPWMASGGVGDVLTGVLAGLVAQFGVHRWEKALCFGVYGHGRAGDVRLAQAGAGPILASSLLPGISLARQEILRAAGER